MDERTRAILASDFTQAQKVVWMTVDALSDGGWCVHSQREIAEAMNSDHAYVNRTLQVLEEKGWIERDERGIRCLTDNGVSQTPEGGVSQTTVSHEQRCATDTKNADSSAQGPDRCSTDNGVRETPADPPPSSFPLPPMINNSNPPHPSSILPRENDMVKLEKSSSPVSWIPVVVEAGFEANGEAGGEGETDGDSSPRFAEGDWQFDFAAAALKRMKELGVLSGVVGKQLQRDGPQRLSEKWADTFRLLDEQDGWSQEDIRFALGWLFQPDNRWIENRWIQSIPTLRKKTGTGDKTKFEAIYNQAKADETYDGPGSTDRRKQGARERVNRATEIALRAVGAE